MTLNDLDPNDTQMVAPPPGQGSVPVGTSQQSQSPLTLNQLNAFAPESTSTSQSTPSTSDTGFSPIDIVKQPFQELANVGTRVAEAGTKLAEPLMPADMQANVEKNLQQTQQPSIPGLGTFNVPPMTSVEQAGGEFTENLANPVALATGDVAGVGFAPAATRALTMGTAGALAGGGQAAALNESLGQVGLATTAGGLTGLAMGSAAEITSALVAKGVSQTLADAAVNRYQAVFQPTEEDIQAGSQYRALLSMQKNDPQLFEIIKEQNPQKFNDDGTLKIPQTLGTKALAALPSGSTQDLLDKVSTNLEMLRTKLTQQATESGVTFQLSKADQANYTELLQSVQDQFGNKAGDPAFSATAAKAKSLLTTMQRNGGTMGPADVLELRQFLDDMRKTKDFNTNATLSPKGEQFKGAADKLRTMFNEQVPGAKKTMSDFVDNFNFRDSLLDKASKESKPGFSLSKLNIVNDALKNTRFNTTVGRGLQGLSDFTSGVNDKISSVLGSRTLSSIAGPIRVAGRTLIPTTSGAVGKLVAPPNQ